ncbi:MAG: leucine-rich repeat domain-containing protein [Saprospiraceae bacterium]|nr:leucine-rich repeat domain-containing protein [Saprospiraceae bacterium]
MSKTWIILAITLSLPIVFWINQTQSQKQKAEQTTYYSLKAIQENPTHIMHLDLTHLPFVEIPAEVLHCTNLRSLSLNGNWLAAKEFERIRQDSCLPQKEIQKLLYFKLQNLPDAFKELKQLENLDLQNNRLTTIPKPLALLPNLKQLNLSGNLIQNTQTSLEQLSQLQELNLANNYIQNCPVLPSNITKIDLSINTLQVFPSAIFHMHELAELDLAYNQISQIDSNIQSLQKLEVLDLSHNQLQRLPTSFQQLRGLKSLNLSYNQLTILPQSLKQLKQLEYLNLSKNWISPKALQELQNLLPQTRISY